MAELGFDCAYTVYTLASHSAGSGSNQSSLQVLRTLDSSLTTVSVSSFHRRSTLHKSQFSHVKVSWNLPQTGSTCSWRLARTKAGKGPDLVRLVVDLLYHFTCITRSDRLAFSSRSNII